MELFLVLRTSLKHPHRQTRRCRIFSSMTAVTIFFSFFLFFAIAHFLYGGYGNCCSQAVFQGPQTWIILGSWNGSRALNEVARKWKGGLEVGAGVMQKVAGRSRASLVDPQGKRPLPSCRPDELVYMYELPTEGLYNVGFFDMQGCWKFFGHHPRNACAIYDPDLEGLGPPYRGAQQARLQELGTPPESWMDTGQFASEIMFHRWLERQYPCRTWDPEEAVAFYVPFYSGIAHMYNYELRSCNQRPFCEDPPEGPPCQCPKAEYRGIPRLTANDLLAVLDSQPYLRRNRGRDHFMVISRVMFDVVQPWGCCSSGLLTLPETKNFMKLGIETEFSIDPEFQMGIPYPTCFHPWTLADVQMHQHAILHVERRMLVTFVGTFTRPGLMMGADLRRKLEEQCSQHPNDCRHLTCDMECECPDVLALQLSSTFCLQPAGDTATRRSIFDSLQAGCIPVLFQRESAYDMYPHFLPADEASYSVYIRKDELLGTDMDIVEHLRRIPLQRVRQMREVIAGMLPNTTYFAPVDGVLEPNDLGVRRGDAFHIALTAALESVQQHVRSETDQAVMNLDAVQTEPNA